MTSQQHVDRRPRIRELGLAPGGDPGATNTIVDVPGVRVGHTTLHGGLDLHTGVTAVLPDAVDIAGGRLPAGLFVGNGYGKLVGATQLAELGEIETPILLTGTLSVFRAADALLTYMLAKPGNEDALSLNPVVGETNDGWLSDVRRRPLTEQHVLDALAAATSGAVEQGSVGAGAGTCALGFKGGIGSASRVISLPGRDPSTVGVLVQTNFSGTLTVKGVPIPSTSANHDPATTAAEQGNSCMIVVAVDAGLDARQLRRVGARTVFAMDSVGADYRQGSGDYAIAFGTAPDRGPVADRDLDPFLQAAREATEEAILDSLLQATTVDGIDGHRAVAVPVDEIRRCCE